MAHFFACSFGVRLGHSVLWRVVHLGIHAAPPSMGAGLCAFRARHDRCRVKRNDPNQRLADCVSYLRRKRRAGKVTAEQIAALDVLGFVWFRAVV